MLTMNDFYDKNLTDLDIVEKTLKTVYLYTSDDGVNLPGTYKIFPLAAASANESFYVLNYLTNGSDAMKQSTYWHLRSGYTSVAGYGYTVNPQGSVGGGSSIQGSYGVRPAFVLKI